MADDIARRALVRLLFVLLGAGALATASVLRLESLDTGITVHWLVLVVIYLGVEFRVVSYPFRGGSQGFVLTEIPLVLGFFGTAPPLLVAAAVIGTAGALATKRTQRGLKYAINLAHYWVAAAVGVLVFRALLPATVSPAEPRTWVAAVAGALAANYVSVVTVQVAIWITSGELQRDRLIAANIGALLGVATSVSISLLAAYALVETPVAVLLLVGPLAALDLTLRVNARERDRAEQAALQYEATHVLQRADTIDDALVDVLVLLREHLHGRYAELLLLAADDRSPPRRLALRSGATTAELVATTIDRYDEALDNLLRDRETVLSSRDHHRAVADVCRERNLDVFVAATVRGERTYGQLLIGNHEPEVQFPTAQEERTLATLANVIAVWMDVSQLHHTLREVTSLQDELSHQAYHDHLTGLPNRAALHERLDRVTTAADTRPAGLLFIDLDDFKSVNDAHGHAIGDALLVAVAGRLRSHLRDEDLPARIGGDEFAILIDDVDLPTAVAAAERISRSCDAPYDIGAQRVSIGISVGVAATRAPTTEEWLQRADRAMYEAKRGDGSVAVWHEDGVRVGAATNRADT